MHDGEADVGLFVDSVGKRRSRRQVGRAGAQAEGLHSRSLGRTIRCIGAGVPKTYADAGVEALLKASGVSVIKPAQYMDKWRLDRKGLRPVANTEVKKALGFN